MVAPKSVTMVTNISIGSLGSIMCGWVNEPCMGCRLVVGSHSNLPPIGGRGSF